MAIRIIVGDALAELKKLPDQSVQCWVTSPPYWGLRDYLTTPLVWGGDAECEHVWNSFERPGMSGGTVSEKVQIKGSDNLKIVAPSEQAFCQLCGAWLGSLGLEPTVDLYVQHLVEIFREARRVLRDDGTFWLNLGDSHMGSWGNYAPGGIKGKQRSQTEEGQRWKRPAYDDTTFRPPTSFVGNGLKPKDLVGIPWRVALALQADGWWLRSDIIWHKPNGMPESVQDRPTQSHEYVFLLSKSARYFYDAEAIKEDSVTDPESKAAMMFGSPDGKLNTSELAHAADVGHRWKYSPKRNKRTVWTIPTQPFPGTHFATFPRALVEPMIKAGTSEEGCCPTCGAPWKRITEKLREHGISESTGKASLQDDQDRAARLWARTRAPRAAGENHDNPLGGSRTLGWSPTCNCPPHKAVPCVVGDMFSGAGTVGLVADRLGRDALLIELNPEYAEMTRQRIAEDAGSMFLDLEIIENSGVNDTQQLEMFV